MENSLKYRVFLLALAFFGTVFAGVHAAQAAPIVCEVTSETDINNANNFPTTGSFRTALFWAMGDGCIDKKITFKVPKITMNAPMGIGMIQHLKGYTIEPDPTIPSVEIVVNYDNPDTEAGCSAPSPFSDCFAYLPASDVTIRNIMVTVAPLAKSAPLRGLCIDKDEDVAQGPSNNRIRLEKNEFNGFSKGGVFVSHQAYGVLITQSIFHDSGFGIVVEPDPASGPIETPSAPVMGGSNQAAFAILDDKGAVKEYHLRGLTQQEAAADNVAPVVELFESDGKAGTQYVTDCKFFKETIDGKWNIECIIPNTITLPFNYAVTLTRNVGIIPNINSMTSMFSVGTIPPDVAKVPSVTPSEPQKPVAPPTPPIKPTNPPAYQEPPNGNLMAPLSLQATPSSGGCSLIR